MSDRLLAKIKSGKRNHIDTDFPGTDVPVRIQILSNQDILDSTLAADKVFKLADVAVSFQNVNEYQNEITTQQLFRACVDISTGETIAVDISQFRKLTTCEERNCLIEQYNALSDETNPSPTNMSADEYDTFVEAVKKNAPTILGNISSIRILKKLILSLVNQQPN